MAEQKTKKKAVKRTTKKKVAKKKVAKKKAVSPSLKSASDSGVVDLNEIKLPEKTFLYWNWKDSEKRGWEANYGKAQLELQVYMANHLNTKRDLQNRIANANAQVAACKNQLAVFCQQEIEAEYGIKLENYSVTDDGVLHYNGHPDKINEQVSPEELAEMREDRERARAEKKKVQKALDAAENAETSADVSEAAFMAQRSIT